MFKQNDHAPLVVVGSDGLEGSHRVVEVAAERAGPDGTPVVVQATKPVSRWMAQLHRDQALRARTVIAWRRFDKLALEHLGTARIESGVVEGSPDEALISVARGRDAREIVVGSRRPGRFGAMLGSVSHRVLRRADHPIVVVPQETQPSRRPGVRGRSTGS